MSEPQDETDAEAEGAPAHARDENAGIGGDGLVEGAYCAESREGGGRRRPGAVAPDGEIVAFARERDDIGVARRPLHDLAKRGDHLAGECIPRRGALDDDVADAVRNLELDHVG
jgi:hypothetical protein